MKTKIDTETRFNSILNIFVHSLINFEESFEEDQFPEILIHFNKNQVYKTEKFKMTT